MKSRKRFLVLDNEFNKINAKALIGRIFKQDEIPSYVRVKELPIATLDNIDKLCPNKYHSTLMSRIKGLGNTEGEILMMIDWKGIGLFDKDPYDFTEGDWNTLIDEVDGVLHGMFLKKNGL